MIRGGSRSLLKSVVRRETIAGGVAGLIAGALFALAMQGYGMKSGVAGLAGLRPEGYGLIAHLTLASLAGAAFGLINGYQRGAYAATIVFGVVYGLLGWVLGPLTLGPMLNGDAPSWSVTIASAEFPSLIGHLMFGGLTALAFYQLVALISHFSPVVQLEEASQQPTKRVLILGGGFGGLGAAQRFEQIFRRDLTVEVSLVSDSNSLLFTPMLAEVASSGLDAQHISAPIRAACPHTQFHHAEVVSIDIEQKRVDISPSRASGKRSLWFDHLIISMGSVPDFYDLPGLKENAFTLKTLEDASRLRNHVITCLEQADVESDRNRRPCLLTCVVAGGGFAGTEAVAELFDLVRSVKHLYPGISWDELRFVLVHSRDRILPELSPELGAYALGRLRKRGIEFMLGRRVARAGPNSVTLDDETEISTDTLVWTAGNQPNLLLRTLPCEKSRDGRLVVTSSLQLKGHDSIWAVGDGAQVPDPENDGGFYPPTAQHALREGKAAADNIAALLNGELPKEFRFKALGTLVGLGHRTAAAEIAGRRFSGLLAWFMWRTIYLGKLPGLERKTRVALDWLIDLFFPRDIALTGEVLLDRPAGNPNERSRNSLPPPSDTAGDREPT